MNSISNQLDITQGNLLLNQAKNKLKDANRFSKILKAEQTKVLNSPSKEPIDKKLMNVCYEFESMLVNQMFKAMRSTVHKENFMLNGGQAEQIFEDMLYDKYALQVSKASDFGLAKQIYNQLNQKSILSTEDQ